MNTEGEYRRRWQPVTAEVREDLVLISRARQEEDTPLLHLDLTVFTRRVDGRWERVDAHLVQWGYSREVVQQALVAAGFSEVRWRALRAGQGQRWMGLAQRTG